MKTKPSEVAFVEFQKHFRNVHLMFIARRVWDRVLRTEDRTKLGASFEDAITHHQSTIDWWRVLYPDVSDEQAVLEISKSLGAMDEPTHDWLMRELVPKDSLQSRKSHPVWNRDSGKLMFEGEIIRRVRTGVGIHITKILDAFEEDGWPERIDSPILKTNAGMVHRDAIRKLNSGLRAIRFRSDGTGDGICWEMISPSTV
ncbi:MAG: hypothetical protein WCJ09_12965 [Planctomycetota bacterium]